MSAFARTHTSALVHTRATHTHTYTHMPARSGVHQIPWRARDVSGPVREQSRGKGGSSYLRGPCRQHHPHHSQPASQQHGPPRRNRDGYGARGQLHAQDPHVRTPPAPLSSTSFLSLSTALWSFVVLLVPSLLSVWVCLSLICSILFLVLALPSVFIRFKSRFAGA